MKTALCTLFFALGMPVFCQQSAQPATERPAISREDLEKLQKQLIQTRREASQAKMAAEKAANGQRDAASAAEKQSEGIQSAVSAVGKKLEDKIRADQAAATAARKAKEAHDRMMVKMYLGIAGFVVAALLFTIAIWRSKQRAVVMSQRRVGEARRFLGDPSQLSNAVTYAKLPDDPVESQVEQYSQATGLVSFPGMVRVPEFDNVLVSGGTFRKNGEGAWVVDYPGIVTRIFAKRRRSAKEYYLLHQQSNADQQGKTAIQ